MAYFTPAQRKILEAMITFPKDSDEVKNAIRDVLGDVGGNVEGNVGGNVLGDVVGSVLLVEKETPE